MKKIALLAFLSFASGFDEVEYDLIFNRIKEPRIGMSEEQKNNIRDPFAFNRNASDTPVLTSQENNLSLQAIFEDKVKISSTWYTENDIVQGYEIIEISPNEVKLKRRNELVLLKISKENGNVRIK